MTHLILVRIYLAVLARHVFSLKKNQTYKQPLPLTALTLTSHAHIAKSSVVPTSIITHKRFVFIVKRRGVSVNIFLIGKKNTSSPNINLRILI